MHGILFIVVSTAHHEAGEGGCTAQNHMTAVLRKFSVRGLLYLLASS